MSENLTGKNIMGPLSRPLTKKHCEHVICKISHPKRTIPSEEDQMEKCWLRPTSCCVRKVIHKDFARGFVIKSLVRTDIIVFADIVSKVHTKSLRAAVFVDVNFLGF